MPGPYRYIQAFSIDIALGGVIGTLFVSKYIGVELSPFVILELFMIIWIIYTFDHLMDSAMKNEELITTRHKIHRRLSATIWGVWGFVLIIAFSLLFKVPSETLWAGSVLAALVVVYFLSLKILRPEWIYHKEVLASIIYAAGVFLGPLSVFTGTISLDIYVLFSEFVILALINLFILSMFEQVVDIKSGFHSMVSLVGYDRTRSLTYFLIILVIVISISAIIIFRFNPKVVEAQLIVLTMDVILGMVLLNKRKLMVRGRFRVLADAVFFIPLIYIYI